MPKISIIVPVFNTEYFLQKCLESVRNQTFIDWECILVNDGSSDSSGQICDEYSREDNRFKVIHKRNGGASSARNIGLENAIGEYVCFCDSDDWVDSDWLEGFVSYLDADFIAQGLKYRKPDDDQWHLVCFRPEFLPISLAIDELYSCDVFGYLVSKCFKRSIITQHNIRFNESFRVCEDEEFISRYLIYVDKVAMVPTSAYNYLMPDFGRKYKNIEIESDIQCSISIIESLFLIQGNDSNKFYINNRIERILNDIYILFVKNKRFHNFVLCSKQIDSILCKSNYKPKELKMNIKLIMYYIFKRMTKFIID